MKLVSVLVTTVIALGWVALFLSSKGVLINSERVAGKNQDNLLCTYFIATSTIDITYWYAPNGFMGKAACPRTTDL